MIIIIMIIVPLWQFLQVSRLFFVLRSCMFMGSTRSGSYFKGAKSPSIRTTRQETRPEGSWFVRCCINWWPYVVIIHISLCVWLSYISLSVYIYIYVHLSIKQYIYIYIHTHIHMHTYIGLSCSPALGLRPLFIYRYSGYVVPRRRQSWHVYTYIYIYIYTHIFIYTHINHELPGQETFTMFLECHTIIPRAPEDGRNSWENMGVTTKPKCYDLINMKGQVLYVYGLDSTGILFSSCEVPWHTVTSPGSSTRRILVREILV